MSDEIDAETAARLLGVKRETLYAYASRGFLRRRGRGRHSLYLLEDVERLRAKHDARSGHGAVAAAALRFGEPVLDTSITEITPKGPRYRGHDAVSLVEQRVEFERVAELLWSGELPAAPFRAPTFRVARPLERYLGSVPAPLDRLSLALPLWAQQAGERHFGALGDECALARRLVATLFRAFTPDRSLGSGGASESFIRGLSSSRKAADALGAVLVLLADHELNASSFAARVAASTGADLFACLAAAVATLSGPKHGAASQRVESLLDEVGELRSAEAALEARAKRGDTIPGIGHPLYPHGDPRGRLLLELARGLGKGRSNALRVAEVLIGRGLYPNVDFGTVAVCDALQLPRGTATLLFALGRSAGWVAHVFEQRTLDFVLRPRARYVRKN